MSQGPSVATGIEGAPLALREPTLEWSFRAGSGDMGGLAWAASEVDPDFEPLRQFDEAGQRRFRHYPYNLFIPPSMVEQALAAQHEGQPTAWEALLLLFARSEWMMASRDYLWTPYTHSPVLLATLVETYGIDSDLHRRDGDSLRRLAALLPTWHPYRGTVSRARDVLEMCELDDQLEGATTLEDGGKIPSNPDMADELFTCHVGRWWQMRSQPESAPEYRISDGFLRFQPADDAKKWVLRREDVLLCWTPGQRTPKAALRLLPSWSVVRLVVQNQNTKTSKKTKKKGS